MKKRTWILLLLMPLFVAKAFADLFGIADAAAFAQRVTMIANQGVMLGNQVAQLAAMGGQLTKLTEQFEHIKESTLGQIGAITQPFTDLASVPGQLVGSVMSWKSDFSGVAGELAEAVEQLSDGINHPGHAYQAAIG